MATTQSGPMSEMAAAVAEALDLLQQVTTRNERRMNDAGGALTNSNSKDAPVTIHTSRLKGGLQVQEKLDSNVLGQGAELIFDAQAGTLQAFDHGTGLYLDLNIKGKNVTISASGTATIPAHAAQHQNGGSDEVATATPAANAIPKAGADGTLAAGWLSESWTNVSSFSNSWGNYAGYTTRYRKELGGVTRLSGKLTGGTLGATMFTLASGYRPTKQIQITAYDANSNIPVDLVIETTGTVYVYNATAGCVPCIDGCTFTTT